MLTTLAALYTLVWPIPAITTGQPMPAARLTTAASAAIEPMTEAQKQAIKTVMQDAASASQQAAFLDTELYNGIVAEQIPALLRFLNIYCQGYLNSPAFSQLPPPLRTSIERMTAHTTRLLDIAPTREQHPKQYTELYHALIQEKDFLRQYCREAASIDWNRENARNTARFRFYYVEYLSRPEIRRLLASKAYRTKEKQKTLLNRALRDARFRRRNEYDTPAQSTPEEQAAIIRYIGQAYIAGELARLEAPGKPEEQSDIDTSGLPQDLRNQLENDQTEQRGYSSKTSRLILEKTGMCMEEHMALLKTQLFDLLPTRETEVRRRLNLPDGDPDAIINRLSLSEEQRKNSETKLPNSSCRIGGKTASPPTCSATSTHRPCPPSP